MSCNDCNGQTVYSNQTDYLAANFIGATGLTIYDIVLNFPFAATISTVSFKIVSAATVTFYKNGSNMSSLTGLSGLAGTGTVLTFTPTSVTSLAQGDYLGVVFSATQSKACVTINYIRT